MSLSFNGYAAIASIYSTQMILTGLSDAQRLLIGFGIVPGVRARCTGCTVRKVLGPGVVGLYDVTLDVALEEREMELEITPYVLLSNVAPLIGTLAFSTNDYDFIVPPPNPDNLPQSPEAFRNFRIAFRDPKTGVLADPDGFFLCVHRHAP